MPFCHWRVTGRKPKGRGYSNDPKTLGEHVKRRRKDLGLPQKAVAAKLGVNVWTLANWEKGETEPMIKLYPAIIRFLRYNPLSPAGETFPERLKAVRLERGLSYKQLARELGVWDTTVRDWENGTHKPTRSLYDRLCRLLGLPEQKHQSR